MFELLTHFQHLFGGFQSVEDLEVDQVAELEHVLLLVLGVQVLDDLVVLLDLFVERVFLLLKVLVLFLALLLLIFMFPDLVGQVLQLSLREQNRLVQVVRTDVQFFLTLKKVHKGSDSRSGTVSGNKTRPTCSPSATFPFGSPAVLARFF